MTDINPNMKCVCHMDGKHHLGSDHGEHGCKVYGCYCCRFRQDLEDPSLVYKSPGTRRFEFIQRYKSMREYLSRIPRRD